MRLEADLDESTLIKSPWMTLHEMNGRIVALRDAAMKKRIGQRVRHDDVEYVVYDTAVDAYLVRDRRGRRTRLPVHAVEDAR